MSATPSKAKADKQARNQESSDGLKQGMTYSGTVVSVDPVTRSFTVSVQGAKGSPLSNCVWASGVIAGLLGMKTTFIPTPGTQVLVVPGPTNFVVGCIPTDSPDFLSGGSKTITGSKRRRASTASAKQLNVTLKGQPQKGATAPNDLLEGELEIGNSLGVAMTLLTTIARISAGGRAKIEACLVNDMVRIVSDVFKHHSAFGDVEIYNDGRLNYRVNGTSYDHEAWGVLSKKAQKLASDNNIVNLESVDALNETGRWRYSEFIGFLGDMVHQMVTEPTEALGKFAADATRAGKGRFQIMADGTMLMQSVTEIVIERVSKIVVPVEKKRWDDPTGQKKADMEKLSKDYLKIWAYGKEPKDVAKTCYQLREYARWLSGLQSYSRFLQMSSDWDVPSEGESPAPTWTNREEDRETTNPSQKRHIETYSCFRIMRDGSQVLLDGYGNAYVSAYEGVQISSARHLDIYAAGDLSLTAGQNIYMKSRRSIEMAAVTGGIKIKARTWLHQLCEWGSVWIKSDASEDDPKDPAGPEDPEPVLLDRAMVIETTNGKTIIRSEKELLLETMKAGDADIVLQSAQSTDIRVISGMDVLLTAKGMLSLDFTKDVVIKAKSVLANLTSKVLNVIGILKVSLAGAQAKEFKGERLIGISHIAGPERPGGIDRHVNHIGVVGENEEIDLKGEMPETENEKVEALQDGVIWDFEEPSEYIWAERELFETLSEQKVRLDDEVSDDYDSWSTSSDALQGAPRTGTKAPFPGKAAVRWQHSGGHNLYKPLGIRYSGLGAAPTAFTQPSATYKFLKRS